MLRRAWKPIIGTTVLVGGPGYLYYRYSSESTTRESFGLPVRVKGPNGKSTREMRTLPLLSKDEVEARLKEHERLVVTPRPNGIVWKQATTYLASNDPIEDANASKIIQRDPTDPSVGDLLFYTVLDGHAGPHTSQLLSHVLLPAVALELSTLIDNPKRIVPKASFLQDLRSFVRPTTATPVAFDADPKYMSHAIQTAFLNLDSEIVNAPIRLLAEELSKMGATLKSVGLDNLPDLSKHPMAVATMQPALSGACALLALFDTAHRNLYVALTGDCRAVAGVWEATDDGKGKWRVDVLTEDQTGRNPNELRRIRSEHPPDEADTVIMRGRVMGGLEPTRAFGDANYKWSREVHAILKKVFLDGSGITPRSTPAHSKTPPYVTPIPVVTHRKLDFIPDQSESTANGSIPSNSKSSMRFLVIATDGLWDELSSEEVVALVGGHLAGLKGNIPKSELPSIVPTITGSTVEGKNIRREEANEGAWAFVDDNVSTHLIRNAFGGADEVKLRKKLSIPAPYSRSYRDDVTCTVVYWEVGQESEAKQVTGSKSFSSDNKHDVKAKL
ncbi:protein serine/threonine phosphatase 2C [Panus rudis PR-1116 ss-1]|nr:protein serine/threonine phosphatase 2C [Panus rudis PR-1116 ss-1]